MIVEEKALMGAMKRDYKEAGYEIAGYSVGEEKFIMIHGAGYVAELPVKNVSRKLLALIVEHLGMIPGPGEAATAKKKAEVQMEVADLTLEIAREMDTAMDHADINRSSFSRTRMTCNGMEVWQNPRTLQTILVDPELTNQAAATELPVLVEGKAMVWAGTMSRLAIMIHRNTPAEDNTMRILSQYQWKEEGIYETREHEDEGILENGGGEDVY